MVLSITTNGQQGVGKKAAAKVAPSSAVQEGIFAGLNREIFDQANQSSYIKGAKRGLSRELIQEISRDKGEPAWMLTHRLRCYELFLAQALPTWGPDLSQLDLNEIVFYAKATEVRNAKDWDELPPDIKRTFDRLGIPEAERKMLAGAGAQYESETVYHKLKERWEKLGVVFEDMDQALRDYPDLVQKHFMKCVPPTLHKFAALHGAVWSGGTFLYVPKGVHVQEPLQAYFRMNAKGMGQFEHTLIIVEEGAEVHYIEGCSAPKYGANALHAGCVEIFVGERAKVRYSSVENWSKDTYNLNTKRALVGKSARMEWVGGNMGSGVTMLYPCSVLQGEGAQSDHLGIAFANEGQIQDTGSKVIHAAPHTSSSVVMKSISKGGGVSVYRGLLKILLQAHSCSTAVECDALILDDKSRSDTIPYMQVDNKTATIAHEARVGRISAENIFYLMSRGLSEEQARSIIVSGFIEPIVRELPLEYAVEMNRLIALEMEGSVG